MPRASVSKRGVHSGLLAKFKPSEIYETRMHSSWMRTVRNSSRLLAGGGGIGTSLGAGTPPGDLLQGMLGYQPPPDLLQGMLGYHPPPRTDTHL